MRLVEAALTALIGLTVLPARASDDDPQHWLERMSESLTSRNYVGVFTHATLHQSETMRIVHRVGKHGSTEKLMSLDGSGREIIRTTDEVHVYMPDRRVVLVEPRTDGGMLLGGLPTPGPELSAQYDVRIRDGSKLLGRDVRILDVRPHDAFRYGYRLWLDEQSAMPLRTVVVDGLGRPVEVMNFTQLDMPRHVDARETEPSLDASGFQWVRSIRPAQPPPPPAVVWRPMHLPPGFRLVASRMQIVPGIALPVQHLIFSDGFAFISVFIEPVRPEGAAPPESSSVGSANAYSAQVHGRVVTAVGEVPLETVRDIAMSVAPSPAATEMPGQSPAAGEPSPEQPRPPH